MAILHNTETVREAFWAMTASWSGRGTRPKRILPSTAGLELGDQEINAQVLSGAKVTCQRSPHSCITLS